MQKKTDPFVLEYCFIVIQSLVPGLMVMAKSLVPTTIKVNSAEETLMITITPRGTFKFTTVSASQQLWRFFLVYNREKQNRLAKCTIFRFHQIKFCFCGCCQDVKTVFG